MLRSRASKQLVVAVLVLGALIVGAWKLSGPTFELGASESGRIAISEALRADPNAGFEPVLPGRGVEFPRDHGPHPEQQTEWWYFTGNLEDEKGRRFGFQLTFFRIGLAREKKEGTSAWRASDLSMAHFTLSDADTRTFRSSERFARSALGLAGAQAEPFRVWTENWSAESASNSLFPIRLRAREKDHEIDLLLQTSRPPVLQGDEGYSRKGEDPGNASMYVAFTRMKAEGKIRSGDRVRDVSGQAWMDHEWSTSVLDEGIVGWDWFSLQLDDGRDLMLYGLRREDGTFGSFSAGSLVSPDGSKRSLRPDDFLIDVLDTWQSDRTKIRYPSRWRLKVPSANLDLTVRPLLAAQELDHQVAYWEGAVVAESPTVKGRGYVELVGYAHLVSDPK